MILTPDLFVRNGVGERDGLRALTLEPFPLQRRGELCLLRRCQETLLGWVRGRGSKSENRRGMPAPPPG